MCAVTGCTVSPLTLHMTIVNLIQVEQLLFWLSESNCERGIQVRGSFAGPFLCFLSRGSIL